MADSTATTPAFLRLPRLDLELWQGIVRDGLTAARTENAATSFGLFDALSRYLDEVLAPPSATPMDPQWAADYEANHGPAAFERIQTMRRSWEAQTDCGFEVIAHIPPVRSPEWSPNCPDCGHALNLNVSLKDYGGGDVVPGDECPACHLIRFHDTGLVVSRKPL